MLYLFTKRNEATKITLGNQSTAAAVYEVKFSIPMYSVYTTDTHIWFNIEIITMLVKFLPLKTMLCVVQKGKKGKRSLTRAHTYTHKKENSQRRRRRAEKEKSEMKNTHTTQNKNTYQIICGPRKRTTYWYLFTNIYFHLESSEKMYFFAVIA